MIVVSSSNKRGVIHQNSVVHGIQAMDWEILHWEEFKHPNLTIQLSY